LTIRKRLTATGTPSSAINGGQESACGWCKDKWGVSWQITPRVLTEALAAGGDEAKRAFDAMMGMKKIDVAAIQAARRGR
ncbi:MAG: VOC family protein, partial [Myxococcales bacterium]